MNKTLFVLLFSLVLAPSIANAEIILGQAKTIDGDTIAIDGKEVELLFINAPELDQTCYDQRPGQFSDPEPVPGSDFKGGILAAEKLFKLIGKQPVSCKIYRWVRSEQDLTNYGNQTIFGVRQELFAKQAYGDCRTSNGLSLSAEMAKNGTVWKHGQEISSVFYRRNGKVNRELKEMYNQVLRHYGAAKENAQGVFSYHYSMPRCDRLSPRMRKGKLQ